MLKIQDKDFSKYMTDIEVQLVRTYKGDIVRTQTGAVSAFPTSFITVGLQLTFVGVRAAIDSIEQLILSADVVDIRFPYNIAGLAKDDLRGAFSATTHTTNEMRNKQETCKQITVSFVSDGTDIKRQNGEAFKIYKDGVVIRDDCAFGKVYSIPAAADYFIEGAKVPTQKRHPTAGNVLVLGDTYLTSER